MASALAESPSVRMRVHFWLLRVPASLASSSLAMPAFRRAGGREGESGAGRRGGGAAAAPGLLRRRVQPCSGARASVCVCGAGRVRAPVRRLRLAPSVFLSSLLCLNWAHWTTFSTTPVFITFFRRSSDTSHLLPKPDTLVVSVSLVCAREARQAGGRQGGGLSGLVHAQPNRRRRAGRRAAAAARLRVERRVLDARVDEHPEVVLHLEGLEVARGGLVLLVDLIEELRGELVGDVVGVGAALDGPDAVHEGGLRAGAGAGAGGGGGGCEAACPTAGGCGAGGEEKGGRRRRWCVCARLLELALGDGDGDLPAVIHLGRRRGAEGT